jgi:hypothetical protein
MTISLFYHQFGTNEHRLGTASAAAETSTMNMKSIPARASRQRAAIVAMMPPRTGAKAAAFGLVLTIAVLMAPSMSTVAETGAGPVTAAQPPSKQQIESAQATMEKATRNLASMQNDPCYPVMIEKEFARLQFGTELPWITCTEVRVDVTWELADTWTRHSGWPQDTARYRLHETYPGYAKVVYDSDRRSLVRQIRVEGPSGDPARAELEAMSAVLLVEVPKGKPRIPDLSGLTSTDPNQVSRSVIELVTRVLGSVGGRYASVQTNRTDVFFVNADTARFRFKASSDYSAENRFLSQSLEMNPAQVSTVENRLVAPPGRLVDREVPYMPPVNMISDIEGKQLAVDEVMKSLSHGVLEKTFPVRHEMHMLPAWSKDQRGKVTVRIRGKKIEKWRVTVDHWLLMVFGAFKGKSQTRAGLKVHWRRTIEFEITDDEYKSGSGKNKLVELTSYSEPPGVYETKPVAGSTVGTGTDIDYERWDQVKNAKKFNPKFMTPEDAKLKEKWEKISQQKTPFTFPESYPVPGTKNGNQVTLEMPTPCGFVVAYHTEPTVNASATKMKLMQETINEDRYTVNGNLTVSLQDGWIKTRQFSTSFQGNLGWTESSSGSNVGNVETITVVRLKE